TAPRHDRRRAIPLPRGDQARRGTRRGASRSSRARAAGALRPVPLRGDPAPREGAGRGPRLDRRRRVPAPRAPGARRGRLIGTSDLSRGHRIRQDQSMAVIENAKLSIIGAGAVGTSLAYAALIRESAREVALYDIDARRVEAEVLDLAHGTPFTGASRITGGAELDVVADSNVVVVTAGAKQKPGQTRRELAGVNAGIIRDLMPQLVERAPNAVFVIVSNPCDVLA